MKYYPYLCTRRPQPSFNQVFSSSLADSKQTHFHYLLVSPPPGRDDPEGFYFTLRKKSIPLHQPVQPPAYILFFFLYSLLPISISRPVAMTQTASLFASSERSPVKVGNPSSELRKSRTGQKRYQGFEAGIQPQNQTRRVQVPMVRF